MKIEPTSLEVTEDIRISVRSRYASDESAPDEGRWVFAYEITIENQGREAAQLLRRHWIIRDAFGQEDEVEGEGVVGATPRLEPGGSFTYSSWCPLPTDFGHMQGSYLMRRDDGSEFDAFIAPFALAAPSVLN